MDKSNRQIISKRHLHDEDHSMDEAVAKMSPAERLAMVWEVTKTAWAFKGEPVGERGFCRHVVRVVRRGS